MAAAEAAALHPPDAMRLALKDRHMQNVRNRMSMAVGVFAVVHAVTPQPCARQSNVRRQATEVDKSDTPSTKRRKPANAVVRRGKSDGISANGMDGMVGMVGVGSMDGLEYGHVPRVEPNNITTIVGGIVVGQVTHARGRDDDLQELVFAPVDRVKNWSLSRWCEKDNEEPDIPCVDFDWPESDDETVV